jgi:hypothetical protein
MKLPSQSTTGTIRLKTYFFNTTGIASLTLSFKEYITCPNFSGTGATFKIQSSSDGVNWTDETWSYVTVKNAIVGPATITTNITHNLNNVTTMISFVATGTLTKFTAWYIDDIEWSDSRGYWKGGTAGALTDWNTPANWGDNLIPAASTNVYVPQRTYLPVIASTPATCNNLLISPNSNVTVGSGRQITVNGKLIFQAP